MNTVCYSQSKYRLTIEEADKAHYDSCDEKIGCASPHCFERSMSWHPQSTEQNRKRDDAGEEGISGREAMPIEGDEKRERKRER